jgi:peroxiredoxin
MHPTLQPGMKFPDIALPDTGKQLVRLSDLTGGKDPIAVVFYRGWW